MSLTPGARLGTYEILTLLGVGGMGEVYRARDTRCWPASSGASVEGRTGIVERLIEAGMSNPTTRLREYHQARGPLRRALARSRPTRASSR